MLAYICCISIMPRFNQDESVPVIGIKGFRKDQLAGRGELLFNELLGEKHIDKPHRHDFFMIILFDQASGIHHIDAVDYDIGNREVHILFPVRRIIGISGREVSVINL